jgi:hypothetical protein
MKGTVSNCHAPLGYPYTRGDHCWRATGTTAFAAALICRYSYDAPRREEDASKNERAAQNGPGTRDCFRITHGRFYERIGLKSSIWNMPTGQGYLPSSWYVIARMRFLSI